MIKHLLLPLAAALFILPLRAELPAPAVSESIVLIGNGLGERMIDHPYFEADVFRRFPAENLSIRNLCRPGDTPGFRPHPSRKSQWAFPGAEKFRPQNKIHAGEGFYPTPDEWLTTLKADTIIAFFGYNESFDGLSGLENFKGELAAFIKYTFAQKYNGRNAPRLLLVSPIAFEDLSKTRDLPNGQAENVNLQLYTRAMSEVAAKAGVPFVEVFTPTAKLYPTLKKPFTRNGFLPNDDGYRTLASMLVEAVYGPGEAKSSASEASVLAALKDRNWFWFNDYRMLNGVHVDGRRFKPYGPDNYPAEQKKMRQMVEARDRKLWALLTGKSFDLEAAAAATSPLPEVKTNYQVSEKNGTPEYKYGKDAEAALHVPEGFKVEMFASEKEFPNLANPMQLSFDNRGRLWVAVMPTYPHYRPGDALPNDKLLIYEDTDGDGKADKETVFADHLHLPIGFEFAPGGVYVSQEPHLMFLADADGDDHADSREVVLTGFDSHDTHHAISAFTADPSGAIMMCEGVFLHSNVETPYGPVRGVDGGFYRFSPQQTKLEKTAQLNIPNPWGVAFDRWGEDFFLHTSSTAMNWMLPVSLMPPYGSKAPPTRDLIPKGQAVRPTSGLEFVSSRHFPDEVQGDILLCNAIGFLGIKEHSIDDDGAGYKTAFRQELLKSSDGNFRPSDLEFAPDGSLYVIDWHNVLIGHMQHNARDPLRDHVHGRIYRITYPARPLVKPAEVAGASVATLLENLKLPEYRSRYRTRRELRAHPAAEVLPAIQKWVAALDPKDPDCEHRRLEALWASWGMDRLDVPLLKTVLQSPDFHARAAAVRVLRYHPALPEAPALLQAAAQDPQSRVRLEAIVAATWLDRPEAMGIVETAKAQPLDAWMTLPLDSALARLNGSQEKAADEHPAPPPPAYLSDAEKKQFLAGHKIYFRDAHCATCHQPDGKGIDPAFPSLHETPFVHGDKDRLIKLVLYGLIGPFEINGKKYDGLVPMTPFNGLLTDQEAADVMTYVRNTFGNKAPAITADDVAKIRRENIDFAGFYKVDKLLQQHPLEEKK